MSLRLINYMGSNGSGKSTRTFTLVKYLQEHFTWREISEAVERKNKDAKLEVIGTLFSNGWFVLGRFAKDGGQWVSLDTAIFSNWDTRLKRIPELKEKYPEITTIFMEGYFNNRSKRGSITNWEDKGCTEVHLILTYYEKIEQFIERTNNRTGKDRGLDWAENSSGWSDNILFGQLMDYYSEDLGKNENNMVWRIGFEEDRDVLVWRYFKEHYVYVPKSITKTTDEWL